MNAYAQWFDRHRVVMLLAVIVATLVAAAGTLRVEFDDNARNLFRSGDQRMRELERIFRQFGSDDNDCIILIEAPEIFSPEAIRVIRSVSEKARALPRTDAVFSLDTVLAFEGGVPAPLLPENGDTSAQRYSDARAAALRHPIAAGRLVSTDAAAALIVVRLDTDLVGARELAESVGELREIVASEVLSPGIFVAVTGVPVIRVDVLRTLRSENIQFLGIGSAIGAVIALILFRRLAAVVIVSGTSIVGALWLMGLIGLLGERINAVNSVTPTLVLVIAFTDSVHLLFEIRRNLAIGLSPREAARNAVRDVGPACAITSITTAVGFASLTMPGLDVIQRFGAIAASGAFISFAVSVTIVPLLAGSVLGRHIGAASEAITRPSPVVHLLISPMLRRPIVGSIAGIGLTAVFIGLTLQLYPSTSLREALPDSSEASAAVVRIDEKFGGVLALLVLVEWDESLALGSTEVIEALERTHELVASEPLMSNPLSVLNMLDTFPGDEATRQVKVGLLRFLPPAVLARIVRPDLRRTIVTASLPDDGTHVLAPVIRRVEGQLTEISSGIPGVELTLSGTPVVASLNANRMIRDLALSLGLASIVIFIVMVVAVRSFMLALLSIIPNMFPLVAAGALLVLLGRPLTVTAAIAFCVCLGIAVDDTVHVLCRFRHELARGKSVPEALEFTFVEVGSALVTTTLVLLGGFGALLLSDMPIMSRFGGLCCVALIAALVGDLVILPALLAWVWGRRGVDPVAETEVEAELPAANLDEVEVGSV